VNSIVEVIILVEGQTEKIFIEELLIPYIADKNIFLCPIMFSKPGEKGGDVRFSRAKRDIGNHLKQRQNTYISVMMDYYAIKDWPGLDDSKKQKTHTGKAEVLNGETAKVVQELFPEQNRERRFIPYVSMYETEALYFCAPAVIAGELNVNPAEIESILHKCGEPEAINDNPETAPSKRLIKLSRDTFKKTSTGIAIAKTIGIQRMRESCPLFNDWIGKIEALSSATI
jgi:hypothetical protein